MTDTSTLDARRRVTIPRETRDRMEPWFFDPKLST